MLVCNIRIVSLIGRENAPNPDLFGHNPKRPSPYVNVVLLRSVGGVDDAFGGSVSQVNKCAGRGSGFPDRISDLGRGDVPHGANGNGQRVATSFKCIV